MSTKSIASGITASAVPFYISDLLSDNALKHIVHIALDDKSMRSTAENLGYFCPTAKILTFPAWDCLPYDRVSPNSSVVAKRIEALAEIIFTPKTTQLVVVTTINALLQRVPDINFIRENSLKLKVGESYKQEAIIKFLIKTGYVRSGKVMEAGEFAVRGGIIDILPPASENAFRLDFFGDNLEAIRTFDMLSQVSEGNVEEILILPVSEFVLGDREIAMFKARYHELFGAVTKHDPLYEAVTEHRKYTGMEHWLPLFVENQTNITKYFDNPLITLEHLAQNAAAERLKQIQDFYQNRLEFKNKIYNEAPYNPLPPKELYLSSNELEWIYEKSIQITPFVGEGEKQKYTPAKNFISERKSNINVFEAFKEFVNSEADAGRKIIAACYTEGSADRMRMMLLDHGMQVFPMSRWMDIRVLQKRSVGIAIIPLESGFSTDDFTIVSEQDILGERIIRKPARKKRSDLFMQEASSLNEGEIVVHKEHGVGRFEGLVTLTASGAQHDCLKIIYDGDDKLFVPVENIDVISRFGSEEEQIRLDKLGSTAWQQRKARLKERIKLAAEELLKVAAMRELKTAVSLGVTESEYQEFCARFPYSETDDQLRAIEDTLTDIASGKPTDRLICGDVGFGKTEVALRAAFAAVSGGRNPEKRQVAILCPTTLLCRQHYINFSKRFEGFPVKIAQLSRLVSAKHSKEIKESIKNGDIDIVIGTHALLAKTIEFRNLVMVIVDEEQHFGVAQKERLKQLKSEVHVISLSATPIPRTLQMSLSGIRELSLITTPPVDRMAVRTFVMPFDAVVIREAILREHYRGGKIFYVSPRLKDLPDLKAKLSELVPEIKIGIAHGQMAANDLDSVVSDFYEGKFDLLLSTNIVESGLDIPSANTIILHRSDLLGLSQLYQLRGRVGRGKIRAYAYFTVPYGRTLSKAATRRLEVMQTLDTLGAGFSVASHDMDIRGFGNLVGEEQSGHIKEVGIELYQQMLEEAVNEAKRAAKAANENSDINEIDSQDYKEEFSPQINLGIPVLIPEYYVSDLALRLGLYKRAGNIRNEADVESFAAELIDRFGALPDEVKNLLEIVKIKSICRSLGIDKIDVGPKGMVVGFYKGQFNRPDAMIDFLSRNQQNVKLKPDGRLFFSFQSGSADKADKSDILKVHKVLHKIAGI